MNCKGCQHEKEECYDFQRRGYDAGLEFREGHVFFFVLDKDGDFIISL